MHWAFHGWYCFWVLKVILIQVNFSLLLCSNCYNAQAWQIGFQELVLHILSACVFSDEIPKLKAQYSCTTPGFSIYNIMYWCWVIPCLYLTSWSSSSIKNLFDQMKKKKKPSHVDTTKRHLDISSQY